MQSVLTIRPLEAEDAPSVSEIVASGYTLLAERQGFSATQLEDLLAAQCSKECVRGWSQRWRCFVAEVAERKVGAMALDGNCLEELWILPECHGSGIGRALFRHAEQEMAQSGESKLTVRTTGYATGFYERMGAVVVGTRVCPGGAMAGWTLTCLEKPLKPPPEF